MGKHTLRNDPECENCGSRVEKRFCPVCGQENIATRQSGKDLILHFFEDLTHYEGKFWSSMRLLLFRPGYLSEEYMRGKRTRYFPPVRMYIFISFVTFLLPSFLPGETHVRKERSEYPTPDGPIEFIFNDGEVAINTHREYRSVAHYDSLQAALPESERAGMIERYLSRNTIHLAEYSPPELGKRFLGNLKAAFPKGLFIFMPVFALVLWLIGIRKRAWYFDHAIFTLHYFSFLLLYTCIMLVITALLPYVPEFLDEYLFPLILLSYPILFVFYFFKAYFRFYQPSLVKGFLAASFSFLINLFLFIMILSVILVYAFVSIQ